LEDRAGEVTREKKALETVQEPDLRLQQMKEATKRLISNETSKDRSIRLKDAAIRSEIFTFSLRQIAMFAQNLVIQTSVPKSTYQIVDFRATCLKNYRQTMFLCCAIAAKHT
jgi:hypothetical protein